MKLHAIIFFFLTLTLPTSGLAKQIAILSGNGNTAASKLLAQTLKQRMSPVDVITIEVALEKCDSKIASMTQDADLIISIGYEGFQRSLLCTHNSPLLATFIHRNTFHDIQKKHSQDHKREISALYLDPKIGQQFDLIEAISLQMNFAPRLGILIGPYNRHLIPVINRQSSKRKLHCEFKLIEQKQDPIKAWDALIKQNNILLAIPDRNIFNQRTARGMLQMASRHRIPVVAYSRSFVNIGALAGLYSSKRQMIDDITVLLQQNSKPELNQLPSARYPNQFSLAVNYHTAVALNIKNFNKNQILQAMNGIR